MIEVTTPALLLERAGCVFAANRTADAQRALQIAALAYAAERARIAGNELAAVLLTRLARQEIA
jgi:hypothetical protein